MKKKKARILLISKNKEIKEDIIIEEQEDIYYFNLEDHSKNRFSKKDRVLTRETKEILLELDFRNKENSQIYLKQEHLEYNLELNVIKCDVTSSQIEIIYELNKEEYLFKIILEDE